MEGEEEEGVEGEKSSSAALGDSEETHAPSGGEEVLAWGSVRHVG